MRISDWSSDVCSSDLPDVVAPEIPCQRPGQALDRRLGHRIGGHAALFEHPDYRAEIDDHAAAERPHLWKDRKSVVSGKSVSVRVDLGGRSIIKKINKTRKKRRASQNTTNKQDT